MKKFRFKLESVLKERKKVEDERLRDWTMARQIIQGMYDQLKSMQTRLGEAFDETTALGAQASGTVAMFHSMESFIKGTKLRIDWKQREIARAEKIVEKAKLLYITARQKREAIEKLRERRLAEYKDAARAKELKIMDDIYIMNGAARRRMEIEDGEVEA